MSSPVCSGQSAYPHTPRGVDTFCFLGPRLPAGRAFLRATTPLSTSSCSDTLCTCPEAGERTSAAFVAPADMMQRLAGLFLRSARTFSSTSFVYDLQHVTYAQTCSSASMQCNHACRVCGAGRAAAYLVVLGVQDSALHSSALRQLAPNDCRVRDRHVEHKGDALVTCTHNAPLS